LIPFLSFAQNYFGFENFKGYSKVTQKEIKSDILWKWETEYLINKDGNIDEIRKYYDKKLEHTTKLIYNNERLLIKEIYFIDDKNPNGQYTVELFYNSANNLIKKVFSFGKIDYYSDYINNKPKRIKFESTISPTESLIYYDNLGNIKKIIQRSDTSTEYINTTHTKKKEKNTYAHILTFSYNNYNDITRIERDDIPKKEYPYDDIDNFKSVYKIENYRYEYNDKGYWTKKYLIINNKETLIEFRKFEL
jgi:hypothetical protein